MSAINPKLRALANHLGPADIRVSGTWANSSYLPKEGETLTAPPEGFNPLLTRDQWRGVVAFAKHDNAKIVTSFPASPCGSMKLRKLPAAVCRGLQLSSTVFAT